MCLVLLALESVPGYPVVLAANREESHARPSEPLHWWPDRPWLAGGRDRLAGGTWLGVRRDGRCATVLNAPNTGPATGARSRGELVPDFLAAADAAGAAARVQAASAEYAGFHFIGADTGGGWYAGGRGGRLLRLGPGLHGADRAGLGPASPRLARALGLFPAAARAGAGPLLELLADEAPPPGDAGDRRPVFLRDPEFGTRCSTLLRIADSGEIELIERRFASGGVPDGETRLAWRRDSGAAEPG